MHNTFGSGIGNCAQHLDQLGKFHGTQFIDAVACHLAGKALFIQPPALAVRAGALLHKLIESAQGMVILLLRPFHQAQTLELGFDPLNPLMNPGAARFPAAKEKKIPLFRGIIPVLFIQVEQTGACVHLPVVVPHPECRQTQHAFVPGFIRIYGTFNIQIQNFSDARAGLAHAVGVVEGEVGSRSCIGRADTGIQKP